MISFVSDEGKRIEYSGDFSVTKQVASFKNFKIKGDVSISFTIPNTTNNREALGYYGLNQVNSPVFSNNVFNLLKDGNTLMRGYLVIEEDNGRDLTLYFISGNANWFRAFEFSCKDISNNGYQVRWDFTGIDSCKANTQGIIFPFIDYAFGRQKFDKYSFCMNIFGTENDGELKINNFPCLYINTLVQELAKVANIRITGTMLDDKLYKSLIITPEGPELFNDEGQLSSQYSDSPVTPAGVNNIIRIENIAPEMQAIEIIKYLCFKFGCVPIFDVYTQTLTLNILEKMDKNNYEDWSAYVQGYKIKYDQYENNRITVKEASEEEIQDYNRENPDALFGELNIETEKQNGSTIELYEDPFAPVMDNVGTTVLHWATPFVQFYELEDEEPIIYTSVTSQSGKAQFNAPVNLDLPSPIGFVFRVEDDNGTYTGYHVNGLNAQDTYLQSNADFISTSTGTIYPQRISKINGGPRILVCIPNLTVNNFTSYSALNVYGVGDISSAAFAYWHKPFMPYSALNGYKPGLSWGDITFDANDITAPIGPPAPNQFIVTLAITAELSVLNSAKFYYRINAGSWVLLKTTTVPVYPSYTVLTSDTITVDEGDAVSIGVLNSSDVAVTFGLTDAPAATYTPHCGQDTDTQFTPVSNVTKYVNLKCTSGSPNTFTTC